MRSDFYKRLAWSAAAAIMVASTATAQTAGHSDEEHTQGGSICGTHLFNDGKEAEVLANTARQNPALYQRIMERAKQNAHARPLRAADGEFINTFLVRNRTTNAYVDVPAALMYVGRRARIWVDTADLKRVKAATITALAKGLDSITAASSRNPAQSIIENDEEVFGPAPNNPYDPETPRVTDFLLTDIKDGFTGAAFVAGFFAPWDQTGNPGSNKMNLLYIDSREGLGSQTSSKINEVLNTMAHEFQHLIHYNTNNQSNTLFNEGCSEVASILNGYPSRGNSQYLANTNVPMFKWNHDDETKILGDYERALTFVYYLYEQCGEAFLTALTHKRADNMERVAQALQQIGNNRPWQELFNSWVVANYAGNFQPFAYKKRLSNGTPTAHASFSSLAEPTGSLVVQQHAAAYVVYNNPGPVKVKFDAGQPLQVMAILYRDSKVVEVWTLDRDVEYQIGTYASYNKIVFGIANQAFNSQTVNWEISALTLGVEAPNTAESGLRIASLSPNPATGPATLRFAVPVAGQVTAALYDVRGALVRTITENMQYEQGNHELPVLTDGLPAGTYMVRLVQGPRSASRTMVVLR